MVTAVLGTHNEMVKTPNTHHYGSGTEPLQQPNCESGNRSEITVLYIDRPSHGCLSRTRPLADIPVDDEADNRFRTVAAIARQL